MKLPRLPAWLTSIFGGPMTSGDARRWAAATTLRELCDLTEQWLTGRIASQPGYCGPVDVDDADDLRDALVALNRVGFLTNSSQEGFEPDRDPDDPGDPDEELWYQRAAVTGFATPDTAAWLAGIIAGTGFVLIDHPCKTSRWHRALPGVIVTWWESLNGGSSITHFGRQASRTVIAGEMYDGCSDAAIAEVCAARQVTVYDPDPGRNELWPFLYGAAEARLNDALWGVNR